MSLLPDTVLAGLRFHWRSGVLYGALTIALIGVLVAQVSRAPADFAWVGVAQQGQVVGDRRLGHADGVR
jgi:hypothetical protein